LVFADDGGEHSKFWRSQAGGTPKICLLRGRYTPAQIFWKIPTTDFSRSGKIFRDENSSRRSGKAFCTAICSETGSSFVR